MGRAAWGSLKYDPKKKIARIRYWADGPDGYRRRSKTLRNVSRKQVEEARAALMLEHGEDAPCPTVGQVWERWVLPEFKQRVESSDMAKQTLSHYASAWELHVSGRWADVPCDQVRALEVQQWLMDGKTYQQALVGRQVFRSVMDKAALYGIVQSNVVKARYLMPPKSTTRDVDKGVWTLAQLGELWRHVHGRFYEGAFILSAFGSCRVGEALGVMVEDVRGAESCGVRLATAEIRRQVTNAGGISEKLKNRQSRRTVVVAGRAAYVLLGISQEAEGLWVTGNGVGGHVGQHCLTDNWKRDVPSELFHPFRNLRNSWQTNMRWELGIPPWLIEPMMGHVGEGVTGQHYDRPQVEVFCETLAKAYRERPYDTDWTWLD